MSLFAILGYRFSDQTPILFFSEFMRLAENPLLVAIPMFTVAGFILAASKASIRLVRLSEAVLGWLPGGMGVITLLLMAVFTAFSGASGITIIAMGGLLFPALLKAGYAERFSLGLLTSSGSIGLLFAPSLPLIIYGIIAGVQVERLFLAGIAPGLLLVAAVSLFCMRKAKRQGQWSADRTKMFQALRETAFELPLPLVVIGGIYFGVFTVTEAATVTAVYVFVVECLVIKDVHPLRDLPGVLVESGLLAGGVLLIIGAAMALTNVFIYLEVPMKLLEYIQSIISSKLLFLALLNVFLLIVGALMDIFSALVVVLPLILPIAAGYGVDPIHLAIIFLLNLEIGYSTPPVGLNLFISSFRFQRPILQLYRAALPFLLIQIIVLLIITYLPAITLKPLELLSGGR